MKPLTTDDVFELLDLYVTSAALGTAMELGLFWLLEEQPRQTAEIAQAYQIPKDRCQYWLQLLEYVGLVERDDAGYTPSLTARTAVLDACSQETWAFLAQESRLRFPAVCNLTEHISSPESAWSLQGLTQPDYFAELRSNPDEARRFTRMLYEIHLPFADEIATTLDMEGVEQLMDLGGGSGVVSLALLRRCPSLISTVVDIPNVCKAGREIARENGMEGRISYLEADFTQDELPRGFDMILDCDVGAHTEEMLPKLWRALNPGGRLVIVDYFATEPGTSPPAYRYWAFLASMENADFTLPTVADVRARLEEAGFGFLSDRPLPAQDARRWSSDWTVIEAVKA